ncbi:hypothetical protein AMS68_000634 [Peltaster fructicola]|uniref:Mitochondrial adapter protein MCP1 transmembrane domain-containing protein n=1 Tax=Peltaster fructicola TaxID=286661 RepID=A0A6H0XK52_9PEZI|nr:hypothetical protein AMS68_000634 [Peltaster fructicola]
MDATELQELEPSPVEETPSNSKDDYFGDQNVPPQPHAIGLSQHSPIWYLTRIQKYSSIAFTAFTTAHIVNTSIIPLVTQSVPASEPYLLLTRPYYQSWPIAEPLFVIAPLSVHIASGVALRLYRRRVNAKRYGAETRSEKKLFSAALWPKVSGTSKLGFVGVPLLLGHTFINRAIPNQFPGGSSNVGLAYVSHAFAKHPLISAAGFTALISVLVFHTTWGWAKWLGFTPDQTTALGVERQLIKKRRWYIINGVAGAVVALWMAGSFGVVGRAGEAPGWVGKMYEEMYQKIPIFGRWA